MINIQTFSDKAAITLSLLCTIHCLAIPLLLALVPSMASLQLDNEAFHFWMLLAVLPTSIYALTLGCKQHKRFHLLALGSIGLVFLVLAVKLPESMLSEVSEKSLTVLGATLVAFVHFKNYKLCRHNADCVCDENN